MLSDKEIEIIGQAKEANPWWFRALLMAATIMAERRKKYAGDQHPYWNFADMAYREGRSLFSIFLTYLNIKMSRLTATGDKDFADERVVDTLIDIVNYALIAAGAILGKLRKQDVIKVSEWANQPLADERFYEKYGDKG